MNNQSHTSNQSIPCAACLDSLADYVRSELNGDNVTETWPQVAYHVETCETCAVSYFAEFRQQGRQRTLAELQTLGERHRSAPVLAQILAQPVADQLLAEDAGITVPAVEPTWCEQLIQHGKLWLAEGNERVRQLSVALGELLTPVQPGAAMAGLMSGESTSAGNRHSLAGTVALPEHSGLEVKVIAEPNRLVPTEEEAAEPTYQVQVAVTLMDRLGDYSGVRVILRWGDSVLSAETDATGIAKFDNLHASTFSNMSLTVSVD